MKACKGCLGLCPAFSNRKKANCQSVRLHWISVRCKDLDVSFRANSKRRERTGRHLMDTSNMGGEIVGCGFINTSKTEENGGNNKAQEGVARVAE